MMIKKVKATFSEKLILTTCVTITPGGGLFPNFLAKWLPTSVLATTTIVIIRKNIIIMDVILVDLFIF